MASLGQLDLLTEGPQAWNQFRRENPQFACDLAGADLRGLDLHEYNLDRVDLTGADLRRSDLTGVKARQVVLDYANLEGADLARAGLFRARAASAVFRNTDLTDATLSLATLSQSDFENATLIKARLKRAIMDGCALVGARCEQASFAGARLWGASMTGADFTGADLSRADLSGADLQGATFQFTRFGGAKLEGTRLPTDFEPDTTTYKPDHGRWEMEHGLPSREAHRGPQKRPESGDQLESRMDEKPKEYGILSPAACRRLDVWFGTNRQPLLSGSTLVGFGSNRAQETHFGVCTVRIPDSHKIGSTGSPWWHRVVLLRPDDRMKLERVVPLQEPVFWTRLREFLSRSEIDEREGLVFLHGYNVSFAESAVRAAQLAADLSIRGAMAMYSWPSRGQYFGYAGDEAAIEASEPLITDFLVKFATQVAVERVHVIAHSMGNRGLLRAVQRMVSRAEQHAAIRFGQVILAAPDVDYDVFRQLAAAYTALSTRTTLYISDRDRALALSDWLHGYPRAGYAPPITVYPGVDTIHVANVDLTYLGHGYVAQAREVLHDIFDLLRHNEPPTERMGLQPATLPSGELYWIIGT